MGCYYSYNYSACLCFHKSIYNAGNITTDSFDAYLSEQDTIVSDMMEHMAVEASGNAAIDYLKGMIPHHESAIAMSESYLKYGSSNEALGRLAQDIIDTQTAEITKMKQLIKELEASGSIDKEKSKGYLNAYNVIAAHDKHAGHEDVSYSNADEAFAEGMVMHHQMAVDMSKAILEYTDSEKVRELAKNIIDLQEKEIKKMKEILKQYS